MREIRRDPTTGREVILSSERAARPQHLTRAQLPDPGPEHCPFCTGHEADTPSTIAEVRKDGQWLARAFANRYPALRIEGDLTRRAAGPYDKISGIGAHEVLVESPRHERDHRAETQTYAMRLARARLRDLARDSRFRAFTWFRNVGADAGATLHHPHAQIIATPYVPDEIKQLCSRFHEHLARTDRELMQDLLDADLDDGQRIILEEGRFTLLCPWAPRHGYEQWIVPTAPQASFVDIDDVGLERLGRVLAAALRGVDAALAGAPYNAVLYSAPPGLEAGFRWHIRIFPRLGGPAGFEIATGSHIVSTAPEVAAQAFRDVLRNGR
jgi:UDPglucose--hexose-1-phosphate uridylyltransferase